VSSPTIGARTRLYILVDTYDDRATSGRFQLNVTLEDAHADRCPTSSSTPLDISGGGAVLGFQTNFTGGHRASCERNFDPEAVFGRGELRRFKLRFRSRHLPARRRVLGRVRAGVRQRHARRRRDVPRVDRRLDRAGQPLLLLRRRWADRLRALLRAVLMKCISSRIASLLSALLLACSGSATFDAGTSDGGGDAGPLEPDA